MNMPSRARRGTMAQCKSSWILGARCESTKPQPESHRQGNGCHTQSRCQACPDSGCTEFQVKSEHETHRRTDQPVRCRHEDHRDLGIFHAAENPQNDDLQAIENLENGRHQKERDSDFDNFARFRVGLIKKQAHELFGKTQGTR